MKKKILSVFLSFCMVITMVPFMAVDSYADDLIDYFYIKNEDEKSLLVQFCKFGAPDLEADVHLQWTTNPSGSWKDLTITKNSGNTTVATLNNKGGKVYLRCGNDSGVYTNHQLSKKSDGHIAFDIDGKFSAGGDIRSLVTNPSLNTLEGTTSLGDCAFYGLFDHADNMVSFDCDLSTQIVGEKAYARMFSGCENLIEAPNINASILGEEACGNMFYGCTSLEKAPNLSATILGDYCYEYMFENCTSLKTPPVLPASEIPFRAYYCMFKKCTGLEYIPELPAYKTKDRAYEDMFSCCTQFKICAEKTSDKCYRIFRMPGSGTMTQTGTDFSKNMFSGTGGIAGPLGNTTYYYERNVGHDSIYNWYDMDRHQRVCSACGDVLLENHSYKEPVISGGLKISECSACGYQKIEVASSPVLSSHNELAELDKIKRELEILKEEINNITTPPEKPKATFTVGKNRIKISWRKVDGATHYQVYYKRLGTSAKIITVRSHKNSKTIKKLKSGKKYIVKVRGIKKNKKTITYGAWSASKKVKVK